MPALLLDGMMMTQSLAIIEYLDETRPDFPLLPSDAPGRQRGRALSHVVAMDTHPVTNMSVSRYGASLSLEEDGVRAWMHRFMVPGLTAFEELLSRGPAGRYCHGDTVTLADLCICHKSTTLAAGDRSRYIPATSRQNERTRSDL